jgi:hypothetical protein
MSFIFLVTYIYFKHGIFVCVCVCVCVKYILHKMNVQMLWKVFDKTTISFHYI